MNKHGRSLATGLAVLAAALVTAATRGGSSPPEPPVAAARTHEDATSPRAVAPSRSGAPARSTRAVGSARPLLPWRRQALVAARWGSGPGELGRRRGGEGSPEGPMSFVVGDDGRVIVLDQVNSRVQLFGGDRPTSVPLPRETFEDLAPAADGLVVLDRLGAGTLLALAGDGSVRDEVPLRGPGIDDSGDVTALRPQADGSWVEVGHQYLVQILDPDGRAAAARAIVGGRPHVDGSGRLLQAARVGGAAAEIRVGEAAAPLEPLARVEFALPLWHITALESAADGRVFLGVELVREGPGPSFELLEHREEVVVLAGDGRELNRVALRANEGPEQVMQRLRVAPDGSVYHLGFDDDGATVWRYAP